MIDSEPPPIYKVPKNIHWTTLGPYLDVRDLITMRCVSKLFREIYSSDVHFWGIMTDSTSYWHQQLPVAVCASTFFLEGIWTGACEIAVDGIISEWTKQKDEKVAFVFNALKFLPTMESGKRYIYDSKSDKFCERMIDYTPEKDPDCWAPNDLGSNWRGLKSFQTGLDRLKELLVWMTDFYQKKWFHLKMPYCEQEDLAKQINQLNCQLEKTVDRVSEMFSDGYREEILPITKKLTELIDKIGRKI